MNPLLKKEIRLLLPGGVAVLLLEAAMPWLCTGELWAQFLTPVVLFFGLVILTVDSFGSEFARGTFLSLLSQPIERREIWRVKTSVLLALAALVFAVYLASFEVWLHWRVPVEQMNESGRNAMLRWDNWGHWFSGSIVAVLLAVSGGLWTSLLLRQPAAAFWITLLGPVAIFLGLTLVVPAVVPAKWAYKEWFSATLLYGMAISYSVAGFWLAHRLFHRAQEVGWTGGALDFSRWRYFEGGAAAGGSHRRRRPKRALIKKEFQLQSISLVCAAALLAAHIGLLLIRAAGWGSAEPNSFLRDASEFFWVIWLILPLIIGAMAFAEERKLGLAEGQFCQPVSRRLQFALKVFPALLAAVLLGGILPVAVELTTAFLGLPSLFFKDVDLAKGLAGGIWVFQGPLQFALIALGLTLAGLYASSLARNFIQALGLAVVTSVTAAMLGGIILVSHKFAGFEWLPWFTVGLLMLVLPPLLLGLTYGNYDRFQERRRLWWRNGLGLGGGLLAVCLISTAFYNRAWEVFLPEEPPHGPARLSLASPPVLQADWTGLQVRFPDGRVYLDGLVWPYASFATKPGVGTLCRTLLNNIASPLIRSAGAQRYMPGTNWVSAAALYAFAYTPGSREENAFVQALGIKADGSLWSGVKSTNGYWVANQMEQIGPETNWAQVMHWRNDALLLKTDGTLWQFGTNWFARSAEDRRASDPHHWLLRQIEGGTNCAQISGSGGFLARKADGSIWGLHTYDKTNLLSLARATNLDQVNFQNFSRDGESAVATVHTDGTLWVSGEHWQNAGAHQQGFVQCGLDTNWVSAALTWNMLIALKSDGSLWRWAIPDEHGSLPTSPFRLGIHSDWVAIHSYGDWVVTLAADGSLWLWVNRWEYWGDNDTLTQCPKQPQSLGNVFSVQ